jgi:hypothetical protein
MFSSQEVRWFLEGSVDEHPELRQWIEDGAPSAKWQGRLGGKPDVYVVIPEASGMGIKWREGQLQIKGLECELGTQIFSGGHHGNVERWIKWSYAGESIARDFAGWFSRNGSGPKIVEVFKTRCLRKVRINPFTGELHEADPAEPIDRGGYVEVTDLRAGAKAFSSVAFEAFPNDSAMHENFTKLVNEYLKNLKGIPLTESNSLSYPAWLQGVEA